MTETPRLWLHATDPEDLSVIAARLQDACVRVADIAWEPKRRRVVLAANRFRWEAGAAGRKGPFERVRSAVVVSGVEACKATRIPQEDPETVLSLLTVSFESADPADPDNPAGKVLLVFSGEGAMKLQVECLDVDLRDITDPWETERRPRHPGVRQHR